MKKHTSLFLLLTTMLLSLATSEARKSPVLLKTYQKNSNIEYIGKEGSKGGYMKFIGIAKPQRYKIGEITNPRIKNGSYAISFGIRAASIKGRKPPVLEITSYYANGKASTIRSAVECAGPRAPIGRSYDWLTSLQPVQLAGGPVPVKIEFHFVMVEKGRFWIKNLQVVSPYKHK